MFRMSNVILFCIVVVVLTGFLGVVTDMFRGPTLAPVVNYGSGASLPGSVPGQTPGVNSQGPAVLPPVSPTVVNVEADRVDQVRQMIADVEVRLADAVTKLDQASQAHIAWDNEIQGLRTADTTVSSFLAEQDDLVEQLTHLLDLKKPSQAEIQAIRNRVMMLGLQARSLVAEPHPVLPQTFVNDTMSVQQDAQAVAQEWANTLEQGRAVVREAERRRKAAGQSSSARDAITTTMPVAHWTTKANRELAQATPPATPSAPPKQSKLDAAIEKQRDALKLRELQDERKRKADQAAKDAARKTVEDELAREMALEQAALVKDAKSSEVALLLQPFLVARNLQPRLAGSSVQMRRTFDKKPMSLSALQSLGALDQSVRGLEVLVRIGSHRDLDGPRWEYRPNPRTWSPETQEKLQQAQDQLRRLGPTLVEQGLLSK